MEICTECEKRAGVKIAKGHGWKKANGPDSCSVCAGAGKKIEALCASAFGQSIEDGIECGSFAVSTSIPRRCLENDELLLLASGAKNFMPLKNWLNAKLGENYKKIGKKKIAVVAGGADCTLRVDFEKNAAALVPCNIYVFGRYEKFAAGLSQVRWDCANCSGKGCEKCGQTGARTDGSVHQEIERGFAGFCHEGTILHGSGREDVDVRTIGRGRPFVLEIARPRRRGVDLGKLESWTNSGKKVAVHGLRFVGAGFVQAMKNCRLDKHYRAVIGIGRQPQKTDIEKIERLGGIAIMQNTPTRVLKRRGEKLREKKIYCVNAEECKGNIVADIFAECGTYIKELINSDSGRTQPSVAQATGTQAACLELVMTGIEDEFLEAMLKGH